MKHIDEIYKDWCGESHITNSCHPVHDSAEACDFAEYYHKRIMEETKALGIASAANLIKSMPQDQAIQQIKSELSGQPHTIEIKGELIVIYQPNH